MALERVAGATRGRILFVRDATGTLDDQLELLLVQYRQRTGVRLSKNAAVTRLLQAALESPRMLRRAGLT